MLAVRYVALTALVVWLGGMVVLGVLVAPATFQVLQASDQANGRWLAGLLFGDVLRRFHLLAYACGIVLFVCLFIMKFVGPPPSAFILRSAIVAAMLALALYSGVGVSGEIDRLQGQVAGRVDSLPKEDARRVRFERLHRTSTVVMAINMTLGLVLLIWYARE